MTSELEEVDRVRTAILASVGHDLRTPLAGIKAAASSLRARDVAFSAADRDELLATVEESADRLNDLVENLLAMSRLQAGVLSVQLRAGRAGRGGGPRPAVRRRTARSRVRR